MLPVEIDIESLTANSVRHRISYLKNHMILPPEYKKSIAKSFIEEKIAKIFEEYQKRLVEDNAFDFDDLLLKPIELFNKNEKIHHKYKKKFSYILAGTWWDTTS